MSSSEKAASSTTSKSEEDGLKEGPRQARGLSQRCLLHDAGEANTPHSPRGGQNSLWTKWWAHKKP